MTNNLLDLLSVDLVKINIANTDQEIETQLPIKIN